jgi:5'-AMP-activated protein kinase catalytic alpha subunit
MHSSSNSLKIEHYTLGRTLGVGAFGKVKSTKCLLITVGKHDITNVNVAIKIINKRKMKNSKMGTKIKREIKLLRYFNHPNIIRLYEVNDHLTI